MNNFCLIFSVKFRYFWMSLDFLMKNSRIQIYTERNALILCWLLMFIGILYRLILWQANRDLFIDEANLARNIYERDFIELMQTLNHEQYAPPIFLWITKLNVSFFNYNEKILRLYPLLAGIVSIFLLFHVFKQFISIRSIWYPLCLFATGAIYLRYSTEFKQYMPDAFVTLILIISALHFDIVKTKSFKFFLIWSLLGSLAIWLSMPSVFILAGIGVYFFIQTLALDNKKALFFLILIGAIWLAQFGFYYNKVLAPQAHSDYLQNFHKWYFVDAFPHSFEAFKNHNWLLLKGLTEALGGKITLSLILNLCLTVTGIVVLIKSKKLKTVLLLIPLVLIYIASAIKSYSLMDRLMLFYMPLWLVLIGIGFDFYTQLNYKILKRFVIILAIIGAVKFNKISYITSKPLETENVSSCLDVLIEKNITANELFVTNLAEGAYVYYTEIHPDKKKWNVLRNAHQLKWDANFKEIFSVPKQRACLLLTSIGKDGATSITDIIIEKNTIEIIIDKADAHAIIFRGK